MNKNIIFVGAIAVAVIIAGLLGTFSDDRSQGTYATVDSSGKVHYSSGGNSGNSISFNGEDYSCDKGDTHVFEHEDGSKTTVTCE